MGPKIFVIPSAADHAFGARGMGHLDHHAHPVSLFPNRFELAAERI
jgi:hypothetical protein